MRILLLYHQQHGRWRYDLITIQMLFRHLSSLPKSLQCWRKHRYFCDQRRPMHGNRFMHCTHLVTLSNSVHLPSITQALRLCAPHVSLARSGTSFHLTACIPCRTPHISPPPPTDKTTKSGFTPLICSLTSVMRVEWPSLHARDSFKLQFRF